jgi:transposase
MSVRREISPETQHLLQRLYRQSRHHRVRQRAHCLWLRSQGIQPKTLRVIFAVSEKTLYNWFNAWDASGLVGLYDRPGRGRHEKLSDEQKAQVKDWVAASPRQLKAVIEKIKKSWDIEVSSATLRRLLKALKMSWRRMRRRPAQSPTAADYARKRSALEVLKRLDSAGTIDLFYLDETGFTLVPPIPYAWQTVGQPIELPSQKSQRLNVLGFMHRQGRLESYVSSQSVTSDVVVACIEAFFPALDKPTVIVMDQASVHVSKCVRAQREDWAQRGLYLFELPTYSPQLNLIEMLWRFMKYEWFDVSAYESWQSLTRHVEKMLVGFGSEFVINFA